MTKQKIPKKIHHTLYWNSFLESKKEEAHEANEYAKFKGHPDVHRLLKNKENTLKKECNKTEKKFTQRKCAGNLGKGNSLKEMEEYENKTIVRIRTMDQLQAQENWHKYMVHFSLLNWKV